MRIRRVLAIAVALAFAISAVPVVAQKKDDKKPPKRSKAEQADVETLVKLVDGVAGGTQPAPTDVAITWEYNHYVKGQEGVTYIPFTLSVDRSKLAGKGEVAYYVRVVPKGAPAAAPAASKDAPKDAKAPARPDYPWDNINFIEVPASGKLTPTSRHGGCRRRRSGLTASRCRHSRSRRRHCRRGRRPTRSRSRRHRLRCSRRHHRSRRSRRRFRRPRPPSSCRMTCGRNMRRSRRRGLLPQRRQPHAWPPPLPPRLRDRWWRVVPFHCRRRLRACRSSSCRSSRRSRRREARRRVSGRSTHRPSNS